MRGEDQCEIAHEVVGGITPACAGRRTESSPGKEKTGDHPRVCGEKTPAYSTQCTPAGSPPRVRGEARFRSSRSGRSRITPACAGRRQAAGRAAANCQDHPRVCGEKLWPRRSPAVVSGSPPRVRGEASLVDSIPARTGITPACAGRSPCEEGDCYFCEDHPRVCGEKCCFIRGFPIRQGSPPRVRGEVRKGDVWRTMVGITPACAGRSPAKAP